MNSIYILSLSAGPLDPSIACSSCTSVLFVSRLREIFSSFTSELFSWSFRRNRREAIFNDRPSKGEYLVRTKSGDDTVFIYLSSWFYYHVNSAQDIIGDLLRVRIGTAIVLSSTPCISRSFLRRKRAALTADRWAKTASPAVAIHNATTTISGTCGSSKLNLNARSTVRRTWDIGGGIWALTFELPVSIMNFNVLCASNSLFQWATQVACLLAD